jgi:4'-phosphopantetheinyl transferase EntD
MALHNALKSGGSPLDRSILASLLGPQFVVSMTTPRLQDDQLFPDELQYVAHAVEKRRAEFGTARVCARQALARLGLEPCSLVPNADRSPYWPAGINGSISHTTNCCAVVVTDAVEVIGVGIDIEEDTPLLPEIVPMICTPDERLWMGEFDQDTRRCLAKLIFSAKEAFYKCQYSSTRTLIDFQEVELNIDLIGGAFSVSKITRQGPQWSCVRHAIGKFRREAGFIIATSLLTSSTPIST